MSSTKKVLLKSSDGETFEVDEAFVLLSETIKNMIDDGCGDDEIPLPNVHSNILPKVIEYCKKNVYRDDNESLKKTFVDKDEKGKAPLLDEDDGGEDEREKVAVEKLKKWEAEYMDIDERVLLDLMLAANYLNIKGLLDLTVEKAASMMRGKTTEEIRETYHIKNDFAGEEEEKIRNENAWAFDYEVERKE